VPPFANDCGLLAGAGCVNQSLGNGYRQCAESSTSQPRAAASAASGASSASSDWAAIGAAKSRSGKPQADARRFRMGRFLPDWRARANCEVVLNPNDRDETRARRSAHLRRAAGCARSALSPALRDRIPGMLREIAGDLEPRRLFGHPEVRERAPARVPVERAEPDPERLRVVGAPAVHGRAAARAERAELPRRRLVLADSLASRD